MINDFLKYSEDRKLFKLQDNILLAVSGGIDSMVMADLFVKTGGNIAIAHCNFSLRGRDSDLDEELVMKFSAANNIRIFTKRFNTLKYASQNHISVQMAARDLRYGWFEELRKEGGFDRIAVAHNLNDNIETLLINLTRGTGITGLAGMKPLSNNIIRPLLFATRSRIADYANTFDVPFREDKSNAETKYIRNRIRHKILPLLMEINPSVEATLNETALRMAGADEIVNLYTDQLRKKLISKKKSYLSVNLSDLNHWLHNQTVIFELFRPYGITGSQVRDLIDVIEGDTGTRIITDNFRIIRNREELLITGHAQKKVLSFRVNEISDFHSISSVESAKIIDISEGFSISRDPMTGCFDSENIKWPVIIRKWKPGDFFYPLGMDHRKKISDYLTDIRCPLPERESALVMESAGRVFWLAGRRIDNRFRITATTKRALVIKVNF